VAFVGAGGKSSLLLGLGAELSGSTSSVVMTTTTRMGTDQIPGWATVCRTDREVSAALERGEPVFLVGDIDGEKVIGVAPEVADRVFGIAEVDYLLAEADGARGRPFKAPASHEPVIPTGATLVVVVAGIAWFVYPTISAWVDRVRLPEVEVETIIKRGPAAAGAVSGAAANGYIVARTRAALSADTPGKIIELNVREGQAIEKGFVVARLYDKEYAASLRRAEADVRASRAALKRVEAELTAAESALTQLEESKKAAAASLREAVAEEALSRLNHERAIQLVKDGVDTPQKLDEAKASLDVASARTALAKVTAWVKSSQPTLSRIDLSIWV
ncbi:MAG: putative selenium-dependent hydroxylase accessory protein YqeC, partial [Proteobacteria bacterium]|nr:putative selenium-dependent hydroxylase accessory protein YqeC [Pseudomonadota bacterium]